MRKLNKHAKGFWEDEFYSTIPDAIHKEFMDHSTAGLIEEYENTIERRYVEVDNYVEGTIVGEYKRREHILLLICHRLDLIRARDILDIMACENEKIQDAINELSEQFKNHRHSRDKTYSEKPVW